MQTDNWWRGYEALKKLRIDCDPTGNGEASNATITAMLEEARAQRTAPSAAVELYPLTAFAAAAGGRRRRA